MTVAPLLFCSGRRIKGEARLRYVTRANDRFAGDELSLAVVMSCSGPGENFAGAAG